VGSNDKSVKLWDLTTGEVHSLQAHLRPIRSLAFSPDGKALASASDDGTVDVWGVAPASEPVTLPGATDPVLAFSPDGKILACGPRLWDTATWKVIREFAGDFLSPAFSPDCKTLVLASDTDTKLWDVSTGQELASLGPCRRLAFSPDGKTLALGQWGAHPVQLWDVRTRCVRATLTNSDSIWALAFSPDGTTLAVGTLGAEVTLFQTETGQNKGHFSLGSGRARGSIGTLAYSPDGKLIAGNDTAGNAGLSPCRNVSCGINPIPHGRKAI
jgi:WD40 repeat protein